MTPDPTQFKLRKRNQGIILHIVAFNTSFLYFYPFNTKTVIVSKMFKEINIGKDLKLLFRCLFVSCFKAIFVLRLGTRAPASAHDLDEAAGVKETPGGHEQEEGRNEDHERGNNDIVKISKQSNYSTPSPK